MNDVSLLTLWSDNPATSVVVWAFIVITVMYIARQPAHQLIHTISRSFRAGARLMGRSLLRMEQRLANRNKEVILSLGKDMVERKIEREFHRVNSVIAKDLAGYPSLHRAISDSIRKIEDDYQNATESPPSPPAWLDAVESVAKIPRNGDSRIAKILDDIQGTIEGAHRDTIDAYRKSSYKRHQLLKNMLPDWRKVTQKMSEVKNNMGNLEDRAKFIDHQMEVYENIRQEDEAVSRTLTSSSLTQFFVSGLVLIIAIFGGIINFQLIALPMSEMVGGTSEIGSMRTADVAALVIIMIEIAMGLFLLDSLRITRLFPVIGSMDDRLRKRMVMITLTILTILASVEASLAYMRDLLALDREALSQSLAGIAATQAEFRWIPSIGQMTMGFILPFALAFVAIPLESFIHSLRTVFGLTGTALLRATCFVTRLVGNLGYNLGHVMITLYDIVVFLPLRVEDLVRAQRSQINQSTQEIPEKKLLPKAAEQTDGALS